MILRASITKRDENDPVNGSVNVHSDQPHLAGVNAWIGHMIASLHTNEDDAVSFLITVLPKNQVEDFQKNQPPLITEQEAKNGS